MNSFFKELAWWNLWKADIANAKKAQTFMERDVFCRQAMRDKMEFLCAEAQYLAKP